MERIPTDEDKNECAVSLISRCSRKLVGPGQSPHFRRAAEALVAPPVELPVDAPVEPLVDAHVEPLVDAHVEPLVDAYVKPLVDAPVAIPKPLVTTSATS